MPPAPQQQQGDTSLGPFWIVAGLFALGLGIWYFAHEQIVAFVLQVKFWEGRFIQLFTDRVTGDLINIQNSSAPSVTFNQLSSMSAAIGDYLKYPIAIIFGLLAVLISFTNPITRYKKTYNMQRLVDSEKVIWPQITPVAGVSLVDVDIDDGPWAMALSPMQFAKKYKLLRLERVMPSDTFASQPRIVATLQREDAYRVFALQTGRYWQGIDRLNPHTKALFAVFAARANRDRDGAAKLLLQIAASTKAGKFDFSGTDELLKKHRNNKEVIKVTQSHAFILTVMASMLRLARTDGVLASADFLWLKPIDRSLWFMLNSIGRQTAFSEVAGPYAHWLYESKFGHRLQVPMVEEAVNGLEAALKDIVYIPDADEQV